MYEDSPQQTDGTKEEITDIFVESLLSHRVEVHDEECTKPVEHGAY